MSCILNLKQLWISPFWDFALQEFNARWFIIHTEHKYTQVQTVRRGRCTNFKFFAIDMIVGKRFVCAHSLHFSISTSEKKTFGKYIKWIYGKNWQSGGVFLNVCVLIYHNPLTVLQNLPVTFPHLLLVVVVFSCFGWNGNNEEKIKKRVALLLSVLCVFWTLQYFWWFKKMISNRSGISHYSFAGVPWNPICKKIKNKNMHKLTTPHS